MATQKMPPKPWNDNSIVEGLHLLQQAYGQITSFILFRPFHIPMIPPIAELYSFLCPKESLVFCLCFYMSPLKNTINILFNKLAMLLHSGITSSGIIWVLIDGGYTVYFNCYIIE
ncbi:hypothetical protein CDL12_16389 [Handroanthus impetiginosus]|uniref:Uncharacterized protein n=1 Tax=Handroanthus impetiginosus TaxID=429701 RepID=A0A2G9H0H0_9LAMI|nr:hypothetical protein CDL12_16389 [Handroanthus impetiginosus]